MALSKEKLSHIDDVTKKLVFGYIRRSQKMFDTKIIPTLVIHITLTYFWMSECWAVIDDQTNVSNDKKTITLTKYGWSHTSFGKVKVDKSLFVLHSFIELRTSTLYPNLSQT